MSRSRNPDGRPFRAAGAGAWHAIRHGRRGRVLTGSSTTEVEESEMAQTIATRSRPAYQAYQILYIGSDVALRDFGLALGALALARLSEEFAERSVRT